MSVFVLKPFPALLCACFSESLVHRKLFPAFKLSFSLWCQLALYLLFSPWGKRWTNVFKRGR